ncbi:MAG: hypothetical protein HQL82_00020 [Magnetococcales bacterium]|nr:hypothetical protein [Magnetococcales bacterium]
MGKSLIVLSGLFSVTLAASTALAYEAGTVSGGGSVTGKVSFKGAVPEPRKMAVTKDQAVCGNGTRELVEVAVKNGALRNAVIYIAGIANGKPWGNLDAPVLEQKGCQFIPDILIVKKDADLAIRNSDPVLHNIHTYEIIGTVRRTMFNVGQPDQGDIKQPVKMRRSNMVKMECDAHDFMHGWAFAADNPYVAVTGEDGSFAIDDLPPGDYELKAWHPVLGEQSTKVAIKGNAAASASFEFTK